MTTLGRKTKIALVGTGGWGEQHARVLSAHADVELCAIAGRDPERTRKRAEHYGANAYTDIGEMLEREQPDLVSLCLPNEGHFEATLAVIQAGFPLLVEKPLVFDLREADRLLEEAEKRSLFFAINFNHRFAKPMQLAKNRIDAGGLGELVFGTWRFGGEGGSAASPYGNLIETQCHGFDSLEFLMGPIASVSAEMTDITGKGFSTMSIGLRFASGAVGNLLGTYDSSYAYSDTQRLEINGTQGRVLIEDTVRRFSFQAAGSETAEVWQAGYFNDLDREFHRTFDAHLNAIVAAFRSGGQPPVHAAAGMRALQLAHAAIRSQESGRRELV
ncbi:Gfo/Idh/MocA family protein [Paenibacillus sacheonensis]|uniref:Gfo/Idh/MocA family oxidoreductase n=1 Tax=Paenibacillus sacheonensis TaxID=742054 RepID=A0A7X4YPR1_9BACL|nr:Gfo/Idh/MocA family oxidoreductase [Paenibacillus sacheonensis]MBM7564925.1 putative dehydrogenase [Paenibacillus sacheonensis]NBC70286.1 Gfo/Idh/MocA family oxidoreductase [Paenibacillus sacheonensis]